MKCRRYSAKAPSLLEDWMSILKLASLWDIPLIRDAAISALSTTQVEPFEKLILAHQYGVTAWMLPSLNELVQRKQPLTIQEAVKLSSVTSWEYVLKIGYVRENFDSASFVDDGGQSADTVNRSTTPAAAPWPQNQQVIQLMRGVPVVKNKRNSWRSAALTVACSSCGAPFHREHHDYTNLIKSEFGL
jgi:hypothetical protein